MNTICRIAKVGVTQASKCGFQAIGQNVQFVALPAYAIDMPVTPDGGVPVCAPLPQRGQARPHDLRL